MRLYHARQKWPIETDSAIRDEVLQISLETAVGKRRPGYFVFAEEKEKHRHCNAHRSHGSQQRGGSQQFRVAGQVRLN